MPDWNTRDFSRATTACPDSGERNLVIGIGGGSASGKSRLAAGLSTSEPARSSILPLDAYYQLGTSAGANFDHPDCLDWPLLERHVDDLRRGVAVAVPHYDFASHTRIEGRETRLSPAPVLVVEGLHVLSRDVLRDVLDLAIFVDAPPDVRLVRRMRRDTTERGRTTASVLDQYEQHVRPMHLAFVEPSRRYADLVLDGTMKPSDLVAIVRAFAAARGLELGGTQP